MNAQSGSPKARPLSLSQAERAGRRHHAQAAVTLLDDPLLWGGPISDERYLLVSAR